MDDEHNSNKAQKLKMDDENNSNKAKTLKMDGNQSKKRKLRIDQENEPKKARRLKKDIQNQKMPEKVKVKVQGPQDVYNTRRPNTRSHSQVRGVSRKKAFSSIMNEMKTCKTYTELKKCILSKKKLLMNFHFHLALITPLNQQECQLITHPLTLCHLTLLIIIALLEFWEMEIACHEQGVSLHLVIKVQAMKLG